MAAMCEWHCAIGLESGPEVKDGTSLSTPLVSGLVALILSAPAFYSYPRPGLLPGGRAQELKGFLQSLAYPRQFDEYLAIWNGVDLKCNPDNPQAPPPPPPRSKHKA